MTTNEKGGRTYDGDIKWVPVRAASKILELSRQRVSYLCKIGALVSVLYDGTRLVSLRSIENRLDGKGR
jgi:hypothetical protein